MIASTLALGYANNNFGQFARDAVSYAFRSSNPAPNPFAIFQTHEPWNATVLKSAITAEGYSYTTFTPAQLSGFTFSDYRVVILNWDDTHISDFLTPYNAALPRLERYVRDGGILWVQAAIQGVAGDSFPIPFGARETWHPNYRDFVALPSHPLAKGSPNSFTGNDASLGWFGPLPGGARVVIKENDTNGNAAMLELCRPTVTSVTPNVGPPAGDQTITVKGSNFTNASDVTFAGVSAINFVVNSDTKMTIVTPGHAQGPVHLRVVTPVGTNPVGTSDVYGYQVAPAVASISPHSGSTSGGQMITVYGTDFLGTTQVAFSGVLAPVFTINSATRLTVTTPTHSAGLTNIRVRTPAA